MSIDDQALRRAVAARDAATRRIQTTTASVLALAAGLTAVFTAVAAGSTHPRHTAAGPGTGSGVARVRRIQTGPVRAPAPQLVAAAQGPDGSAPASSPAAPAQAPTSAPATAPPVVVSGGS